MYRFLSLSTIRFYHKALTGLLLSAWVVGSSHAAIYHIDPTHTKVRFAIDHFKTSTNTGGFYNLTGQLEYDPVANIGNVSLIIPLNSLMTGDKAFTKVDGMLTLHGQTNPVTLTATKFNCYFSYILKKSVCGGDFTTTIDRTKWGISKYTLLGITEKVDLTIQIEAAKQ